MFTIIFFHIEKIKGEGKENDIMRSFIIVHLLYIIRIVKSRRMVDEAPCMGKTTNSS
jgi:hypothetical protein